MATRKGKRKVAVKTAPLTVNGDDYLVRTNIGFTVLADLASENLDRINKALRVIVVEHPFEDEDGEPLDPPDIPQDDLAALLKAYGALTTALPPA